MNLTARQCRVLKLIAENNTHKVIAAELAVSEKTIHDYKDRISHKTGIRGIAALTQYALKHGIAEWIV